MKCLRNRRLPRRILEEILRRAARVRGYIKIKYIIRFFFFAPSQKNVFELQTRGEREW